MSVFGPLVGNGKCGTSVESYKANKLQHRGQDDEEVVQSGLPNDSKAYMKSKDHGEQTQNLLL
jgi:hypothetical protein